MKLLNDYLLVFDSNTIKEKEHWIKLELYLDEINSRIFPLLYCYDEFSLTNKKNTAVKQWMWCQECGWYFPHDVYISTVNEEIAFEFILTYMKCRRKGIPIPNEIQQYLIENPYDYL